jgi:hypothetical protein
MPVTAEHEHTARRSITFSPRGGATVILTRRERAQGTLTDEPAALATA